MNQTIATPTPEKKGRGCFFYGCLSFIILFLLILAGVYFGFKHMTGKFVGQFAEEREVKIEEVMLSPDEYKSASEKLAAFKEKVEAGEAAEVSLNAHELNGLIGMNPAWQDFPGKFAVKISDGKVTGDLSVPLEQYGFSNKFLNGAATLNVGMVDGEPSVSFAEIIVRGQPLPGDFMAQLGGQNLLQEAIKDPEKGKILRRLNSIEARGDTIILKVGAAGPSSQVETH